MDDFTRGQWEAYNDVLHLLNTFEDKFVDKHLIYAAIREMRPRNMGMTRDGVIKSTHDTLACSTRNQKGFPIDGAASYSHLDDMVRRINLNSNQYDYGKLNRWLGWMQCAAYSGGAIVFEEAKLINKGNKEYVAG